MISVLYVDDEQTLLEVAKLFLEETGEFRVGTAISAQEALKGDTIRSCDAIVSDYQMPGMDGVAFLKIVRERYGDIPFILFTGRGREEVVIEAINNGADFYLQKGGDPEAQFAELAHKIRQSVRRKQAEYSLHDSERRLADIIDFLPDATFAIDRNGTVIAWNRAIEDMTGIPAGEMLGKGDHAYAVPFYGEKRPMLIDLIDEPETTIAEFYTDIFRTGNSLMAETDHTHPKGEQIIVLAKACHLFNKAGAITGAIESIRDITGPKRTEEALRSDERRLASIYETVSDVIFLLTVEPGGIFRFSSVNPAFSRVTGIPAEAVVGRRVDEVIPESSLSIVLEKYRQAIREKTIVRWEENSRYPTGELIGEVSIAPVCDAAGTCTHLVGSVHDITARKRLESNLEKKHQELQASYEQISAAEEELRDQYDELARSEQQIRESEGRYRSIIENSPLGMHFYELRADGRLIFSGANPGADRILGIDHTRFIGREIEAAFPGLAGTEIPGRYRDVAENGGIWQNEDVYYDQGRIQGAYNVIAFQTAPRSMTAVFEDITERKRREEELAFNNALLSTQQETSPEAILIVDENGRIVNYNRQFIALWGLPEDLVAKREDEPVLQFVTAKLEDPEAFLSRVKYLYDHREEKSFEEISLKDKRVFERFSSPMMGQQGRYYGRVWYFRDITRRKRTEQELQRSEQRLRQFIQFAPAAMAMLDRDMRYVSASRRWISDFHLAGREIIGQSHYRIFPEIPDDLKAIHRRALAGEVLSGDEERFVRSDGSVQWLSWVVRPWYAADSSIGGIIIYSEDVTGRKTAGEELRKSEEKYRLLTENSLDVIYSMDLDGTITFVSPQASRYGFSADQVIGHNISELVAEEDLPGILADIKKTVATGQSTRTTFRLKGSRENPVWLEDNGSLVRKENGIPSGITGVLRDITDRKRAEEARRKSEAQLQRLAENAPDMIYHMSLPEGTYRYVSPASVALTGYTPEEFYADPGLIRRLIHPAWQEYLKNQWQALLENRAPPFYEYQIIDRAGNTRWVNQRNMPVTDDRGKVVAIEGIVSDVTRQKTVERELKRSELRSLAISENAGEWIWEVNPDGIYRYSSPAVTRILGYRPEELVGKMHYYDLFDPSVRDDLKEKTATGFSSREPFHNFINLNRHRNGTPVLLSTSATPVFDEIGMFTGYCGVDEDITEKQHAQEELTESRQMLAEAMDLAHLVNWVYDTGTDMFTFDDRFYALYGTTVEREGGTRMSSGTYAKEFVHPDDRWMVADEVRKALGTTDPCYRSHVEHRIIRRDGEVRYISVRLAVTMDSSGRIIRTHGANQDITEIKRAEEGLRAGEEKFRNLVETTPDIIWETDLEGKFRYISPTCKTIIGYDPEELTGTPVTRLVPPEIRAEVEENLRRLVTTVPGASRIEPFEIPARHRDGHPMVVEIRIARISGPDGFLTGLRGVARDVTERRQAEEALRLAHKKLHLLTGITRHDITNQLMSLNGFVALLQKKVTDPALEPSFRRITDAGRQISAMIAFTREYEKIGVQAPVWQVLATVVDDAAKGTLPEQVQLRNDLPAGLEIYADPLIVKVFYNLLDNAIRHGERVTRITVSSRQSGENLVVVWEDNGVGIAMEDKERIFEPGFGKNTGLGMFLVREILSLTGITIRETGEPFAGARFEMVVPGGAYRDERPRE